MELGNIKRGNVVLGQILICTRSYIESEFNLYTNKPTKLIHITRGLKYKIENISDYQIQVKNDLNQFFWYDYDRFDTIKNWRKRKLIKLNTIA